MRFFSGIKKWTILDGGVRKFQKPPKLDQIIHHAPKIARISNFLADCRSLLAGLNIHVWLSCCNMPQKKVTAFLTAHTGCRNFENNRFCVPMHLKTNRSTF